MAELQILSAAEQVAAHLRDELQRGEWTETMPGGARLSRELGVGRMTVEAALSQLESEGLLISQGPQRRRKIALPKGHAPPALRVAILDYDPLEHTEQWAYAMRQQLVNQGHNAIFTGRSLTELGMDLRRIARLVKRTPADAWVVCAASREVLDWFARQETPAFALFGRFKTLPIAATGPDKAPAFAEATRRLVALGHRRISFLCHRDIRRPHPAKPLRAFVDELKAAGIATGRFNLPDWEESRDGLGQILDSLFSTTPPTALFFDEAYQFHAGFHHLARRGLRVPEDVSLVCTDPDPGFTWCDPSVAHIRWDYRPLVRRVIRWANNIARGKDDRRQTLTRCELIEGGTMGPV